MWNRRGLIALVAAWGWLIMSPGSGLGSGFALYEAGARGSALGCAVVARADDLSAIFFNPAGLVQLPGLVVIIRLPGFVAQFALDDRAVIIGHRIFRVQFYGRVKILECLGDAAEPVVQSSPVIIGIVVVGCQSNCY